MSRSGQQRLDAIPAAIKRRDEFCARVQAAAGDVARCADLMAEAISMKMEANQMETVNKGGKVTVCIESVMASHCTIDARDAYLSAIGNNGRPMSGEPGERR